MCVCVCVCVCGVRVRMTNVCVWGGVMSGCLCVWVSLCMYLPTASARAGCDIRWIFWWSFNRLNSICTNLLDPVGLCPGESLLSEVSFSVDEIIVLSKLGINAAEFIIMIPGIMPSFGNMWNINSDRLIVWTLSNSSTYNRNEFKKSILKGFARKSKRKNLSNNT